MSRALALLLALAALGAATFAPTAGAIAPRTSLPAIEQEVMCVVCKTPLAVANGPQADAERHFIRGLIAQGRTKAQIEDALVAQYGTRVLALPNDHGFNLAVYLVPIAVLILGLVLLALALPRWRRRARQGAIATATPSLSDTDAQRLNEDLARYDG